MLRSTVIASKTDSTAENSAPELYKPDEESGQCLCSWYRDSHSVKRDASRLADADQESVSPHGGLPLAWSLAHVTIEPPLRGVWHCAPLSG